VAELVGDHDTEVRRIALERLRHAHERFARNPHRAENEEETELWNKLLTRIPELKDPEPQPGATDEKEEAADEKEDAPK
jgi:hypothetical protein